MSTSPSEITKLTLAQFAAESYLDGSTVAGIPVYQLEEVRQARLKLGSNNYRTLAEGQTESSPSLHSNINRKVPESISFLKNMPALT